MLPPDPMFIHAPILQSPKPAGFEPETKPYFFRNRVTRTELTIYQKAMSKAKYMPLNSEQLFPA
jgi:hypothetical protein